MDNQPVMPAGQSSAAPVPPTAAVEQPPVIVVAPPQVPGMQSIPFVATGSVPPQEPAPRRGRGWIKGLIGFVCLLVVLGGAYYAYAFVYNSPSRVWNAWSGKGVAAAAVQYHVNGNVSISATIGKTVGTFSVSTSSDVDAKDASNPLSKSTVSYSVNYGGLQFSANGIQVLEIGKVIYVNLSSVSALSSQLDPKYNGWIKVDEGELAQYEAANGNAAGASALTNTATSPDIQKLQQLLSSADVVSSYKTDGREVVDGSDTYHYSLTIDKSKLKSVMDQALGLYNVTADEQASFNTFIDGATISKSDVWVGVFDHQLHKVDIQLKLPVPPALVDLTGDGSGDTTAVQSPDAQRLAYARDVASFNELYYNDKGGYPATLQDEVPSYLPAVLVAPATQGPCTAAENTYTYTPSGKSYVGLDGKTVVYPSYTFTTCLNQATDGYAAGQLVASPQEFYSSPSSDFASRPTPTPTPVPSPTASNSITVEVTADTSALATAPTVIAPASSDDVLSELNSNEVESRDATRLAYVHELQTGLELYFNDSSGYPATLGELSPKYVGVVPVAPVPADGTCTDEQNTYWYRPGGTPKTVKGVKVYPSYLLGFCLGSTVDGYAAGYHNASTTGIQ